MKTATLALLLLTTFLIQCKNDDDNTNTVIPDEPNGVYEGIDLRDANNQRLGQIGTRDLNDWQNIGGLPVLIQKLLEFKDTVSLKGTSQGNITLRFYPNPIRERGTFDYISDTKVKVKMIVVDENMTPLQQYSYAGTDLSLPINFKNQSDDRILRIYYTFSCEAKSNFYTGHGDVWICKANICF